MRLLTGLRGLIRDDCGAITLFLVFAITTIMAASALAFEFSKYTKAKARFNNALDQAVLAAASANAADPNAYGVKYFRSNLASEMSNINVTNVSFSVTGGRETWRGTADGTMPTTFGRFVGIPELELHHDATVGWDVNKKTEIVAMVDVSGTMCAKFERVTDQNGATAVDIVPDRNCTKLDDMKEALGQIVNIGVGYTTNPGTPTYKAGIVPFTYKVKVANPNNIPSFLTQGEEDAGFGSNYYQNLADAEGSGPPIPAVTPLTTINTQGDKEAFLNKVNQISTGADSEINRPFMKRSTVGASFAGLMLDPRYTNIFGGVPPEAFGSNTRKIVIMMTDSANLGCCFTNWPADNFRNHYVYSYTPDHAVMVGGNGNPGLCQVMKDKGIEIFTVLLDVDRRDMDARGEEIVDSYQSCASGPDHAFEVAFNDRAKLREVYTIIGKAIMNLRITE